MPITLTINGQSHTFGDLASPVQLSSVVAAMNLKGDRVAVELNGEIAQRVNWESVAVSTGDRLEIVHFVGGGCLVRVGQLGKRYSNRDSVASPLPAAEYT